MRNFIRFICVLCLLSLCGCATMHRKPPNYDEAISKVKIIAVMPADIEVYQLTAGGVRELIDEWSEIAKKYANQALKQQLSSHYGFQTKFIEEDWLKENYKEVWKDNQALYEAVATCIALHTFPGVSQFQDKVDNFDYTLGEDFKYLAGVCDADALLFLRGIDHEATAGRVMLGIWNVMLGAFTGVMYIPINPCVMDAALIDGKTGNILWYKITPEDVSYSFRSEQQVDSVVEWLLRDFLKKEQ